MAPARQEPVSARIFSTFQKKRLGNQEPLVVGGDSEDRQSSAQPAILQKSAPYITEIKMTKPLARSGDGRPWPQSRGKSLIYQSIHGVKRCIPCCGGEEKRIFHLVRMNE